MVDARLPERYLADRRVLRLSSAERSSLFMATVWSVSNRTDGRIEQSDLSFIPTFDPQTVPQLVASGLLESVGEGAWVITDYERDQTTRHEFEVLENARRRDREKKRRQRAKGSTPPGHSRGTLPGDSTGKARQGQDRQELGQENSEAEYDETTDEVLDGWPTASIPVGDDAWAPSPDAPGSVLRKGAA